MRGRTRSRLRSAAVQGRARQRGGRGLAVGPVHRRGDRPEGDRVGAVGPGVPVLRDGDVRGAAAGRVRGCCVLQGGAERRGGAAVLLRERAVERAAHVMGVPVSPGWVDEAAARVAARLGTAGFDEAAAFGIIHNRLREGPAGGAGPGGDQRGYRDALAALRGHLHHRGAAAAAPGAALGRPQALAGLVFEAEPGAQVRRRPFMTGQVSSRQAAMASSSRSAARRAGTWTLQPIRCSSTSSPASV